MTTVKRRGASVLLWALAVLVMLAASAYQKRTGPTHELRGTFQLGGEEHRFELIRSGSTDSDAEVRIPDPGGGVSGQLLYKRYPTDDPFAPLPMESVDGELRALLPAQPSAGKLEYYAVLETPGGPLRVPEEETPIIRFKDPVPLGVLVPHIILMFIAFLVGVRAALGALLRPVGIRGLCWTTLVLLTAGGMILGPIVQKYAFGAYWTGWPFGTDLTDNKTLIMWLAWVGALGVLLRRSTPRDWIGRIAVLLAAVVMLAMYLVPHSMRGSELDYSQLEEGAPVEEEDR